MALLAEIDLGSALPWQDDESHLWINDSDHEWLDGAGYALCSLAGFAGDRYWDAFIIDFTPPRYQAKTKHGGYVAMTFGTISLHPDLFEGTGRWPPPPSFPLKVWYTAQYEALKYELFTGSAHFAALDKSSVEYALYGEKHDAYLLLEQHAYDSYAEEYGYTDDNLSTVPRAFGEVLHAPPLRAPDDGSGRPTYYLSGITGTLAKAISATADNGSGKARFTTTAAHELVSGDEVTVEVDDFASTYNVTATATVINATHFDLASVAYVDDQTGHVFKEGWWRAYDDGVPISGNVDENGQDPVTKEYTFSLTSSLVGAITVSGTGTETTLDELFAWACEVSRLNLIYQNDYGRDPSPVLNWWADSQQVLTDFLSEVSSFWVHLFYITKDSLFIVDTKAEHGQRTLEDADFLPGTYGQSDPVSLYRANWTIAERKEDRTGKRLEAVAKKYTLPGSYQYGDEMAITPYSTDRSVIISAVADIKSMLESATASLKIPLMGTMRSVSWDNSESHSWITDDDHEWISELEDYPPPLPGEKLWVVDLQLKQDLYAGVIAMGIQYDFKQKICSIDGRGAIALGRDDLP